VPVQFSYIIKAEPFAGSAKVLFLMTKSGLLIISKHRCNNFKHFAGKYSQCRAALKGGMDAVGIVVLHLHNLPPYGALCKSAVTEITHIFKLWAIRSQYFMGRAGRYNGCRGRCWYAKF